MAEHQLPKLTVRVRFPSSAPHIAYNAYQPARLTKRLREQDSGASGLDATSCCRHKQVGRCSREWACDAPAGQRANQAVDSGRDDLCVGAVISVVTVASVGNRAPAPGKEERRRSSSAKRRRRRIHCAMRERRKEQSAGTPPASQRR